jgi:hypothetical protein
MQKEIWRRARTVERVSRSGHHLQPQQPAGKINGLPDICGTPPPKPRGAEGLDEAGHRGTTWAREGEATSEAGDKKAGD